MQLSYPSYLLKMNQICLDRCQVDLTQPEAEPEHALESMPKPQAKKSDELLYLSDREAVCIEACSRLYLRQTHVMLDVFRKKLTF